ncbi:hypothetical protein E8E13_009521 [Curvularia kusanoi]|uniref:RING-type domain-containing protein n=1 Tax=Curvularia kusanoi TaxID=90978 RepID=A0A9P4TMG0_CURKU|nr:hypothetical protein E8E13_009521 [Curvularia kusanoi]
MAAPDFSIPYQYFVMSTGTGAQRADVSGPWPPALPAIPHRHQWETNFQANNQSLPPSLHYRTSQYSSSNYPQSPYLSYAAYGGPSLPMYSQSMYPFPSHQPRPPPAIRSGHVDTLTNPGRPTLDVPRLPASYGTQQAASPGAFTYSTPPQPVVPGSDAPSVTFGENRPPQITNSEVIENSGQTRSLHPSPSDSDHPLESEQSQQRPVSRQTFLGSVEDADQRVPRNLIAQAYRSDRSSSPRASARRSYNRYSADLTQSGTSSDVEEAAARSAPFTRTRHRRTDSRSRLIRQAYDPRITTGGQIQQLKSNLPKLLLDDLPKDASPACDICAKDYSAIPVESSEEEEVAVKLPCGHYFGEWCISQWFDTCKTHKNKVTCPMCRKQLIEPPQSPYLMDPFGPSGFSPSPYAFARNAQLQMQALQFQQLIAREYQQDPQR